MSIKDEVLKALNYLRLSSNPVGTIIWYIGSDVPEGYLLCNGAEISRTDYARLFSVLGVKCGAGNGTTTFNLPDFDGRVPQATSDPSKVGQKLESQLPNITGLFSDLASTIDVRMGSANGAFKPGPITSNTSGTFKSAQIVKTADTGDGIELYASRSNSTYNGSKLQVSALQVLACIRA